MCFGKVIVEVGVDLFFVQVIVVLMDYIGFVGQEIFDLEVLCCDMGVFVVIGNCVIYDVVLQLMWVGVVGVMVGIGFGVVCIFCGVFGVGIFQVIVVVDCVVVWVDYEQESGCYVLIVVDGGIVIGGDICKCIVCGVDVVMIGFFIVCVEEVFGWGFYWGMVILSLVLFCGICINVGNIGSIECILCGLVKLDDGIYNLLGCLKILMGILGV